jgi:tetraacyldisaccharide-1-P 4'-kinase
MALALVAPDEAEEPLAALRGQGVVAFAAIARPERFLQSVERLGARVVEHCWFGDHQALSPKTRAGLVAARRGS